MKQQTIVAGGAAVALFRVDRDSPEAAPTLIWAHGWGQTHQALLPLAMAMRHSANSILLDLPGFGESPLPPGPWGTDDYADALAQFIAELPPGRRIWIAHSFGGRVGIQLAARHPAMLDGLFLIAAAGLKPRHPPGARARIAARSWAFRLARHFTPEGPARDRLRQHFGSADHRQAGPLRPILVRATSEDLSAAARAVRVPTVLVYGDRDRETPPEIGQRFNALIPQSRLVVLRGFDHWTVLTEGHHQIIQILGEFMEQLG